MSGNVTNQCFQDDPSDEGLQSLVTACIHDLINKMAGMGIINSSEIPGTKAIATKKAIHAEFARSEYDIILNIAEEEYRDRRLRSTFFDSSSLFGEPAWDMLLDLFISELSGRKLSVTSVCIGSGVPPTTALRWLKVLEEADLICRELDRSDGRRSFVRISQNGFSKMVSYFLKRAKF